MKTSSDDLNRMIYGDDEPQPDRAATMLGVVLIGLWSLGVGVLIGWMVF